MFALYDTFNSKIVSRHRTVKAAVKADIKLQRQVSSRGRGSYLPTELREIKGGELVKLLPESHEMEVFECHPLRELV